jgi:hypothetical protein
MVSQSIAARTDVKLDSAAIQKAYVSELIRVRIAIDDSIKRLKSSSEKVDGGWVLFTEVKTELNGLLGKLEADKRDP